MKPFQHDLVVLFDHDGTVVDSETIALKSAWRLTNEVAREFPGAQYYDLEDFVKSFAGKPYRELIEARRNEAPVQIIFSRLVPSKLSIGWTILWAYYQQPQSKDRGHQAIA